MKKRKVFVFLFTVACILSFLAPRVLRADAEYVGSETCMGCHEDYYKAFTKSVHGKKAIHGSPMNREGCESCHGPGSQHVEKDQKKGTILAFGRKGDPRARSAKCLTCHEETKTLAFWNMNRHKAAGVSCDSCHSIHKGTSKELLLAQEPDLCFTCHRDIRFQFNKQSAIQSMKSLSATRSLPVRVVTIRWAALWLRMWTALPQDLARAGEDAEGGLYERTLL